MEKRKRWQFFLILAVAAITIYNILPTIFYYSNPLKKPIGEKESEKVSLEIINRVNSLENFSLSWLKSQSKNLGLKPTEISLDQEDPRLARVTFKNPKEAALFAKTLYRAGALIPFVPAQLSPDPRSFEEETSTVYVQRKIGVHLDPKEVNSYFHYIPKETPEGDVSPVYRTLINQRATGLALGFGGVSEPAQILSDLSNEEGVIRLARSMVEYENTFGDTSPITKRYFASFASTPENIEQFATRLEAISGDLETRIQALKTVQETRKEEGLFLDSAEQQQLDTFLNQQSIVQAASQIVKRNQDAFSGELRLTKEEVHKDLNAAPIPKEGVQYLKLGNRNPFVKQLEIDWNKDTIDIVLHSDVSAIRSREPANEAQALEEEKLNQLLFNTIASVARSSEETISPAVANFTVKLNELTNSSSLLTLDIGALAKLQVVTLQNLLSTAWSPTKSELSHDGFPIHTAEDFRELNKADQSLGLVVYAPAMDKTPEEGFREGSIYVIGKGLGAMAKKYRNLPDGPEKAAFEKEFAALQDLLRQNGFIGYHGESSGLSTAYQNDYIFELDDYYSYLLAATREDFSVKGDKRFAILEFTDGEQRLLTRNKIETLIHEDLVKWKDEYQAAQVSLVPSAKYDVPKPTQNAFLSNMKLSAVKYFRGDERKILKWGLDLSGGKTVRIGLRDQNQQAITDEADLKQAVSELYQRVNKLGVSEVGIRTEGSTIVLDFPGSQGFSAAELIQASSMSFHVANEKFTANNPVLAEAVNTFLEEVWNEAVITNRTDPASLNEIAWQHLGGSPEHPDEFHPQSSHARLLYDNGLRLAGPKAPPRSSAFNDTLSAVSLFRGTDFSDWQGQTYPLLIVFRNFALEGSNLDNVQTGYDTKEGNSISFSVKGTSTGRDGQRVNPRDEFYAWTSEFSEEKIIGTPKESFSQGRGWRMAVILNGTIINAPTLNSPLRDSARITGHFSQREVNQLAADLKAGSLSFTPQILSEENVSPDLGKEQRTQGILAAILGLALVIIIMCGYYRFGGVIASLAVIFNLLIMWGVLQNLGAALTLPGIGGIILAMGMAVDANVLVFERIREEFQASGRLPMAVAAGYRKAFTAIVDSNLTTILAAVILLNFDSGPIKGFALTLIIGIVSSMFTALFMTRYFFAGWVQNPKHTMLKMARLFGQTSIDFLKRFKLAFILSALVVLTGLFFLIAERETIFGMDFTGGYAITLDLQEQEGVNYRLLASEALEQGGAAPSDFQIQELTRPNQLRIQLGTAMELPGKPFHDLIPPTPGETTLFSYQQYPRIVWIVNTLEDVGLKLNPASLPDLSLHWTEMSGQLSDTMRNQALLGLGLALVGILVYITFRFEFKYAISATLALAHDLLLTVGILAILHQFYEGIQIDLQVIAALMTIVGYSLNDTIIIFDRIREDTRVLRKLSFRDVINHALNITLSRTIMTSGTTVSVLIALVIFGGPSIFNFSLIMTLGVVLGTISSLYIAGPILLFFHGKENSRESETSAAKRV